MSGGDDNYKSTLQAVATGEIVQNAKLPVYLILSGGTNAKTTELAKCAIFLIMELRLVLMQEKLFEDMLKDLISGQILWS